ncbi:MAG: OadG family protein [Bacteroidales bacterium]|nr:OadG family protein [Bacteroidales bacterium]
MITTLYTDWGLAWGMAGISVGVVFTILITLVLVLYIFHWVAAGKNDKAQQPAKPAALADADVKAQHAGTTEADPLAIATAVYLYMANQHDEESGILTIRHTPNSAWHAELNKHL